MHDAVLRPRQTLDEISIAVGVNGNGMHTNVSVSKNGKNLFWDPKGEEMMSKFAWQFVDRILTAGNDICLLLNASVNAYRRLDPHFEAPNQIKASATDRGSMVRVPIGNPSSAVNPIVVAMLRPPASAQRLAPLPRCATTVRPSAARGSSAGRSEATYS